MSIGSSPSDFELLSLSYVSQMDNEILWLVSHYCYYVYEQKKKKAHNYTIDVDKFREHLSAIYVQNQRGQNPLSHIDI